MGNGKDAPVPMLKKMVEQSKLIFASNKTNHDTHKVPDYPIKLPDARSAMRMIDTIMSRPWPTLGGCAPINLFKTWFDVSRSWFVGSAVWLPAVFMQPPKADCDLDVVFADEEAPLEFVTRAHDMINCDGKKVWQTTNKFDSPRLIDARGLVVLDAWALRHGMSIAEQLCGFPYQHQRVAYLVGAAQDEISGLVRVVRPAPVENKNSGD